MKLKSITSALFTTAFAALFAVAVGCQPPAEDTDTTTDTDTTMETEPAPGGDSNVTGAAETPTGDEGTETP